MAAAGDQAKYEQSKVLYIKVGVPFELRVLHDTSGQHHLSQESVRSRQSM